MSKKLLLKQSQTQGTNNGNVSMSSSATNQTPGQGNQVSDLARLAKLEKEVDDLRKKQSLVTSVVTKLSDVTKSHDQKIDDLDSRVKALENAVGASKQSNVSSSQSQLTHPNSQQPQTTQTSSKSQLKLVEMYQYRFSYTSPWVEKPVSDLLLAKQLGGWNNSNWRVRYDCLVDENGQFAGYASEAEFRQNYA